MKLEALPHLWHRSRMTSWGRRSVSLALCLSVLACAKATPSQVRVVALVGGPAARTLQKQLAERWGGRATFAGNTLRVTQDGTEYQLVTSTDDSPLSISKLLSKSQSAIVAMDATEGPQPLTRHHLLLVRQLEFFDAGLALINVKGLGAEVTKRFPLLLEDVRHDFVRNLERPPSIVVADDPAPQASSFVPDALTHLSVRSRSALSAAPHTTFGALVYVLNRQEQGLSSAQDIGAGEDVAIVMQGEPLAARHSAAQPLKAGTLHPSQFSLAAPAPVEKGQQFVIIYRDHVAAVGTVASF